MVTTTAFGVFLFSLLTAVATGLGALPFFMWKDIGRRWLGAFNALASVFMLAASALLVVRGIHYSVWNTLVGAVLGVAMIILSQKAIGRIGAPSIADISAKDFRKMALIVGVMTLHSFSEGIGMGVAFGDSLSFGILIIAVMAIQNIPEGLAISLVLCPRGATPWQAMGWSVISSLPQPIMSWLAYLSVEQFRPLLPGGLGFAAGAMVWMVAAELLPETYKDLTSR